MVRERHRHNLTGNYLSKKEYIYKKSAEDTSTIGRVLDGIRLSGMLWSEIALVLRKEQLHIFLCFHQLLHLFPCFAIVWIGCFLLGQQFCKLRIQLLDLRQLLQPCFVKGRFRRLVQSDFLPMGFQKGFAVPGYPISVFCGQ